MISLVLKKNSINFKILKPLWVSMYRRLILKDKISGIIVVMTATHPLLTINYNIFLGIFQQKIKVNTLEQNDCLIRN